MTELCELIYTSMTTETLSHEVVSDILSRSRDRNRAHNITGILYYDGQRFLQVIEGAENNIDDLYNLISHDDRHEDVELLHKGYIKSRAFESWDMAYEALEAASGETVDDRLNLLSFDNLVKSKPTPRPGIGAQLFELFIKSEQATANSRRQTKA